MTDNMTLQHVFQVNTHPEPNQIQNYGKRQSEHLQQMDNMLPKLAWTQRPSDRQNSGKRENGWSVKMERSMGLYCEHDDEISSHLHCLAVISNKTSS